MAIQETVCRWGLLLLCMLLVRDGQVEGCECPGATILARFPLELPTKACCLNYSGSSFGHVQWPMFTNGSNLQILDLSDCNIAHIEVGTTGFTNSSLKEVYLNHNRLATLPGDFLATLPALRVLDLSMNLLYELPEEFLKGSDDLQELDLQGNRLHSLPASVLFQPSLLRLELADNPWDCKCSLVELLQGNITSRLQAIVGNLTCASPRSMVGRNLWSLTSGDVCRPPGLTALFILLPLLILFGLMLCWCCGRKKKRKETPAFGSSKKKSSQSDVNGQRYRSKHPAGEVPKAGESGREGILKNQLLLRPSSTLLGSTRDIYEEVEIKLGSVESLPRGPSPCSSSMGGGSGRPGSQGAGEGPEVGGSKAELDAVSVTEVMKDSADREKAYLTQSTEYYSLVPGMDLEDSDHGEYESVDLS